MCPCLCLWEANPSLRVDHFIWFLVLQQSVFVPCFHCRGSDLPDLPTLMSTSQLLQRHWPPKRSAVPFFTQNLIVELSEQKDDRNKHKHILPLSVQQSLTTLATLICSIIDENQNALDLWGDRESRRKERKKAGSGRERRSERQNSRAKRNNGSESRGQDIQGAIVVLVSAEVCWRDGTTANLRVLNILPISTVLATHYLFDISTYINSAVSQNKKKHLKR